MAQTTNYEIANSSGLIFRGRVNEVFAAVQSSNSGATEPTGTVAYQLWYDTTTNILKMRDATNSTWISLFTVDQTNGVWSVNANSTSNALRITQTGTGNALLVEDSANPDSTPFVITAAGDVGVGTSTPTVKLDVVGTTNSTNLTRGGSQVYSRDNILATVSQTAGVPTGGIIERGSNANGEYVRYADGTLICTNDNAGSQTTPTASGSIFRATNATTWTYPSAFTASPVVSGNADENNLRWMTFDAPSATAVAFRQANSLTSAVSVRSRVMAVGRWF